MTETIPGANPNTPDSAISTPQATPNTAPNMVVSSITDLPNTSPAPISTPAAPSPVVSAISERLAETTQVANAADESKPVANTPMMIDLANLSPEALSLLKSMLQVTPDRVQQKRGNLRVTLRNIPDIDDNPRYVINFKRTRMGLHYHAETNKEVEVQIIPVLFYGATEYVDIEYAEFMESARVAVEVLNTRVENSIIEEGQVVQRSTGKLVTKEVTVVKHFYTLRLPNGQNVEVEGQMCNA